MCYNRCRHIKALSDTERSKNNVGEKTGICAYGQDPCREKVQRVKNIKCCFNCKKKLDTEDERCPNCDAKLCEMPQDYGDEMNENEAAEIISTMMITGIL